MKRLNINLLSGLFLAIILLGIVSAVTVYFNARTYRDLAFDFQRQYMTQLVAAESTDILSEEAVAARRLGLRIQGLESFRQPFNAGDGRGVSAVLDAQFEQAPVTSNAVSLVELYAFDSNFNLVGTSTRDVPDGDSRVCPDLLARLKQLQGARHCMNFACSRENPTWRVLHRLAAWLPVVLFSWLPIRCINCHALAVD